MNKKLIPQALPADISAAITAATNATLLAKKTVEAYNNSSATLATAQKEHDAAAEALAAAEVEAVLCIDKNQQSKLDKTVTRLTDELSEKQRNLDRSKRVAEALRIKATEIDVENRIARENFDAALEVERCVQADLIVADLKNSLTPLLAVLRRAYALQSCLPSRNLLFGLSEIIIPNPDKYQCEFIKGDRVLIGDCLETLLVSWRDDPEAMAIFERFRPVQEARTQLGRHKSFITSQKATSTGYTIGCNPEAYSRSTPAATPAKAVSMPQELNLGKVLAESDNPLDTPLVQA